MIETDKRRTPGTNEHRAAQLAGSMRIEGFSISAEEERDMVKMLNGEIDLETEILKTVEACKAK